MPPPELFDVADLHDEADASPVSFLAVDVEFSAADWRASRLQRLCNFPAVNVEILRMPN
jgi:hypothetical protein